MRDQYQKQPRMWIKWFINPFIHKMGKRALIKNTVRLDVFPYNKFCLGDHSIIEDFATVNNGMGDVIIGNRTRIGIGCVVIGPVQVGDDVLMAQNIILSGMNHGYENVDIPIRLQTATKKPIEIENDVWIGANSIIVSGIKIGIHCVIAGGSVVTKDVAPFTVVGGNPARVIKRYDREKGEWVKI